MEEIPTNGENEPITHGEFLKCWLRLDRRVRTLEITSKITIALATAIFVAVIVKYF